MKCPASILGILILAAIARADPLPPPPPVFSPEKSAKLFQLAEDGFRVELVASEPMVQDPVAIRFDGEGRLWVVEMRGYMQNIDRAGVNDPVGRISVLEDTDRDGIMDRNTVFLDGLVLPRSIAIYPDGVLVAENKPLWFVEDSDDDLVADRKTLIDADYAKDSVEHSANSLYRAMDNYIYNAKEGHRYRRSGKKWIREKTERRGQWGICQDDHGRLFYNYNHSQLHTDLVPPNTLNRNPNHDATTGISAGVTTNNNVFPVRPTPATNRAYIPGALDENGRIKQFTSACAPFVYRERLLPAFTGNAFVCETAGNLIKRSILSHSGLRVTGASAYPDRDLLASRDERFRPCWITTGPDGALYIADMYRGIVQDGPHMSPYLREHSIKRKMDKPIHLGRIWRIVPRDFTQPDRPSFANMTVDELMDHLANPNGWWRDQAQMHLVDGETTSAIPELKKMALAHESHLARLHALWTLEGLKADIPDDLPDALYDESPTVQAAALRVLFTLEIDHERMAREIANLSKNSPAEELILQMILTLGDLSIEEADRFSLLHPLLLPGIDDPLIRDAVMSSLAHREVAFLQYFQECINESDASNPGVSYFLESLSRAIIQSRNSKDISKLLSLLESVKPGWMKNAILKGITILGPDLTQNPVTLTREPTATRTHDFLKSYFAWPGHTPAPPLNRAVRPLKKEERELFTRGRQIFLSSCVACHGSDGKGMKLLAPPLAGSDWVMGNKERLARVLFHGLTGPITVSGKHYTTPEIQPVMPPLASLGNTEIAAVLTYIRREWGNTADPISSDEINKLRVAAQGRTIPWTEDELEPFTRDRKPSEKN